jgi:hypothetical protein
MLPVSSDTDELTLAELLEAALSEPAAPSIRQLARRLAGPKSTGNQVENKRVLLQKYLAGKVKRPTRKNAAALAEALGKAPDHFVIRRRSQGDELAEMAGELAQLQARVSALEAARARPASKRSGSRRRATGGSGA